jgi:hypothetical protein
MDEEENKKSENAEDDQDEGSKSATDEKVKQLNADTERINQAIAENENAKARQQLSGTAEAGTRTPKPKKLTNTEYAEALERGEVNPFKEDGLI